MTNVNIRPAKSSDAEFLAWVMLASSRSHVERGAWDLIIGGDDSRCLDYLKRLAVAWMLVRQAEVEVERSLGWTEAEKVASRTRSAPMRASMPPEAGADWFIEFVATRPEYRRRGLVDALMYEAIRQGVERGCSLAEIMILAGNDPRQRAYEKVGFVVHDEYGSPEFEAAIGAPGFRRLLRRL